jgi:hypothetical protein
MKKSILIPILIVVAVAAGLYLFFSHRQTPLLREAKQYELSGDLEQAYSLYAAVLYESTPSIAMPDIYRSKFLAPEILRKEVGKYFIWLSSPAPKVSEDVTTAMEGIERCKSKDRRDNTITTPVIRPLSADEYLTEWNKTFFAPEAKVDPSHAAMASGNYARKLSLLVINSQKSYTYEINLINTETHRGTRSILLSENSVRLYAVPGEHLLVCRSTVTFPSEEIWRSNYTIIPLTIPSEASLITIELRTSVHRKTK